MKYSFLPNQYITWKLLGPHSKQYIYRLFCGKSIPNMKSTGIQWKAVNRATFIWSNWSKISPVETIPTKINTQHLWNHCGSSHSFYVSFVIAYTKGYGEIIRHTKEIIGYTKDCGEKFQEVQKLIKSFLINSYFQHKLTEKDPFITTKKRQALVVLIMQMHN